MKVPDLFVGKRLFVGCANPPAIALGVGPSEIRGSAYLEGPVLVGTPLSYSTGPNVTEANLMVARCANIEALPPPPSIFKVSTRGLAPTPIDVMLGDPTGHVGITINSLLISIFNDTNVSIVSPFTTGVGALNWVGAKTLTGVVAETGAEARAGKEAVSAATVDNGPKNINGPLSVGSVVTAVDFYSTMTTLNETYRIAVSKKSFDISHPTKKDYRLRYICLEGPAAEVYMRGKLKDNSVINLPDYWKELVDLETLGVSLTPIGVYQELFVEKIEWGTKIIVKNNLGGPINCSYMITAERKDVEKNIPEYEGLTPDDYPGDNDGYNINGF